MALRAAVNKIRPLGWGYHQLGFLGAIRSSISNGNSSSIVVERNCFRGFSPSKQFCRNYYLPPPPLCETVEFIPFGCVFPERNDSVLPFAEFAVQTHNEGGGGDTVHLVRVVRASQVMVAGAIFCITLEAVDEEDGELNVYYAEVLDSPSENLRQLIHWELVDQSFSYPFGETRMSEHLLKVENRQRAVLQNDIMTDWLKHMAQQIAMDDKVYIMTRYLGDLELETMADETSIEVRGWQIENPDPLKQILNFEKSLLNADISPKNAMDPLPAVGTDVIVPIYDIESYGRVYECALLAVYAHNKNEVDGITLEDVLWASKSKVDGGVCYFLLLEARDGEKELNFYFAIMKMCQSKKELIKFQQIDESLCNPLKDGELLPN